MLKKPYIRPLMMEAPIGAGAISLVIHSQAGKSIDTIKPKALNSPDAGPFKLSPPKLKLKTIWRSVGGSKNLVLRPSTEDSVAAFKDRFSALSREQQESIHDLSVHVARKFCKNILGPRHTLINGEDEVFGFPFARVPLSDFDSINSIWEFMDQRLGNSEGPRFIIDADLDVFVFGMAKNYSFKTSPVMHFTEVLESRMPSNNDISKTNALVLHGRDQIFYVDSDLQSAYLKMRQSDFSVALWKLGNLNAFDTSFEDSVKKFTRFRILAHEYGHVLSFKDQSVTDLVLNPILKQNGSEYVHPSYARFHDLGEVYAELFGVMDALIEKRSDLFTLLAYAYYARTLTSPRKHGQARAFALINLFLRNVHVDGEITVDYEGLRRDVDAQKAFLYNQFEMYQLLTDDEIEGWVNGGMYQAVMIKSLQKALGIKSNFDPLAKPPVEAVFRNQVVEELGLEIRIARKIVHQEVKELRKKVRSSAEAVSFDYDRDEMEKNVTSRLSGLVQGFQTKEAGKAVGDHVLEVLGLRKRYTLPHEVAIAAESLSSYAANVNKLMRIEGIVSQGVASKSLYNQGLQKWQLFGTKIYGHSVSIDDMWQALIDAGYLDDKGMIQSKFDGELKDFVLEGLGNINSSRRFEDWIRIPLCKTINEYLECRKRFKCGILSLQELEGHAESVRVIQANYGEDRYIQELSSKILNEISEAVQD